MFVGQNLSLINFSVKIKYDSSVPYVRTKILSMHRNLWVKCKIYCFNLIILQCATCIKSDQLSSDIKSFQKLHKKLIHWHKVYAVICTCCLRSPVKYCTNDSKGNAGISVPPSNVCVISLYASSRQCQLTLS